MENHQEMRRGLLKVCLGGMMLFLTYGANADNHTKPHKVPAVSGSSFRPGESRSHTTSVGTPSGELDVSHSGAAVYSLSIETPNGGALTPRIGLVYNSQSGGYGLAGYGFSITGISAITRAGHDSFHDGRQSGVTYTASDNLLIDGKRLVLQSGALGQDGSAYTVEGDPFTKVIAHGDYNNSTATTWFEVTTNTGMTYQYGNSPSSRVAYRNKSGYPRIASWYVSRATDKYSNYITYEYAISNLSIRPTAITYGTNSVRGRGIDCKVSFDYKSLGANARPFAIEDQRGMTDACLATVTTSCNDSVYRKYTFSYDDKSDQSSGKWTRLVAVRETNGRGEAFPPLEFTWQSLPSHSVNLSQLDVPTNDDNSLVEESDGLFLSADLNGDGVSDIIRVSPVKVTTAVWPGGSSWEHYTYVYVSRSQLSPTGEVTYAYPLVYTLPAGISMDIIKSMFGGASVMDFDGDGYNDMVFPFQNTATGYWNQVVFHIVKGSDVVAGRDGRAYGFKVDLQSTDKAPLFATFDVDGDGKDDVVCVEQRQKDSYYPCTVVRYAGGQSLNRTEIKLTLPPGVSKDIEKVFAGDYNNDGLPDLILLYSGGYKVYFNNGGTAADLRFTEGNTRTGTNFGDCWRVRQGDFDGDGLTDFVYNRDKEYSLWIAHNNGDGTFACAKAADIGVGNHDTQKDNDKFALMVWDIDHDGRSDVMVCKANYKYRGFPKFKYEYRDTQVKWYLSTGMAFELVSHYTKNRGEDARESFIFLGDFNGDGFSELANYGSSLSSNDNTFGEKINVYETGRDLPKCGKVTEIADGMGNHTWLQYATATDPLVYKRSIPGKYPVNTYALPLPVVSKVMEDNGHAGIQATKYSYEDMRLHIAGRGMLGFNTVAKENFALGTRETISVSKWDESLWVPAEVKSSSSAGNDTSTTVSIYSISKAGNNYFAYVSRKDMTDMDGNTATTVSNYDASKGVILDETVTSDGGNMYKKVSYSGYQKKSGVWLPTTLTMTQKHADDPVPYTAVTTYSYDESGNVLSSTINSGTDLALTTTSTYDVYGNVLSSVAAGSEVKSVTRHSEYDPSGRFVVKSHTSPTSAVKTFTYDLWGNVLTECDATEPSNILTDRYAYDGWGRRLSAQRADGTRATYEIGWGDDCDMAYYTRERSPGKPPVTTWYDCRGREVLRETTGPMDMPVSRRTYFDARGLVSRVESRTGKLSITQELLYDDRGRVVSDSRSPGTSASYSYGNRSVTANIAGRSYTKTYDAWGNLTRSANPSGEAVYRYSSVGKPSSVSAHGSVLSMAYDAAGNQTTLSDPDVGTSSYTYAADGMLLTQTDGRGIRTTNSYDDLGRIVSAQTGQSVISYTYGTEGNGKLRLVGMSTGPNSVGYAYDNLGRVVAETREVVDGETYAFVYAYNDYGQVSSVRYPGGLKVSYEYDENGFRSQATIGSRVIYRLEGDDGLVSTASLLGKFTATQTRDERGYEVSRKLTWRDAVLENLGVSYDPVTGNLLSRGRNGGPVETFGYDAVDRLVSVRREANETMRVSYAPNGNILFKTGVGNFHYNDNARPHAVAEVDNAKGEIPGSALVTSFGDLGKVEQIADDDNGRYMDFDYGPDGERWYSYFSDAEGGREMVYAGNYEKVTNLYDGSTREFWYLDGNIVAVRENGRSNNLYVAFTDNLGNILTVMDESGKRVFDASYDAWGRQTVRINEIDLHRGYTGHEMLNEFDLINMNGRLYDPVLGRFLSPDNYVQMPDNSQCFNRYSYCLNNPLKYVDPSGNLFGIDDAIVAFALFNIGSSMMHAAFNGENVWKAGALSLLSSAASYGIGAAFGSVGSLGHELLRAGSHGLASGVVSALGGGSFASGLSSGVISSGIGSFAQGARLDPSLMVVSTTAIGGIAAWATGGDFLQGATQGFSIGLLNHAMHGGDGRIRYYQEPNGAICGEIPEVIVRPSRGIDGKTLATAAGINTVLNSVGLSLRRNGGNSTVSSSGKFYWHEAGARGFYGNQHVSATRLTNIGKSITKGTGPVGTFFNMYTITDGFITDYRDYQNGHTNGYNTVRATADVAGGWVGGFVGAVYGAKTGAEIGSLFGGAGALPGSVIGGVLGGVLGGVFGSFGGSYIGIFSVDKAYGR